MFTSYLFLIRQMTECCANDNYMYSLLYQGYSSEKYLGGVEYQSIFFVGGVGVSKNFTLFEW